MTSSVPSTATHRASSHVDAWLSSGSSPGRTACIDHVTPGRSGDTPLRVAYEVHGPEHAGTVVVLGGISAGRHLRPTVLDPTPGWWPGVVGSGKTLDPARRRLIGLEYLAPTETEATRPVPTTLDQAHALRAILDREGVGVASLVGASYGGMVALAFAATYPERTRGVVALCAAHRTHPMATAVRSRQRRLVALGREHDCVTEALALARGIAMTTYRSPQEFEERFDRRPRIEGDEVRFAVEDYLDARGRAFADTFDPVRFHALSTSIDTHDVAPDRISAPLTLLSFDTDSLVPPWLVEECATRVSGARHVRAVSVFGHDAFLKEHDTVDRVLAGALAEEVAR